MKKFKKILVLALAMMMILAPAASAFAANEYTAEEKALYEKVAAGVVVNGQTVVLPEGYLTQFQNYLMRTDLTAEQISAMSDKTGEIFALVKAEGKVSYEEIAKDKDLVLDIINMVDAVNQAQKLGVTINPTADKVIIKDAATGETLLVATAPDAATPAGTPHTGSSNMGLVYAAVIAAVVLGGSAMFMSKKDLKDAFAQ